MRSKTIHLVQHTVDITVPDEPGENWADGIIQVDVPLSQKYGTTIRNGNQFRLIGYGSQLRGFNSSTDIDTGFGGVTTIQYCPVTRNSVGAHQKMFKAWMAQKKLASAVGAYVNYDDFEVGWAPNLELPTARQSTIRMEGLNDASLEKIVLYGNSVGGDVVSLEEFYDNLQPILPASETYTGAVIKEPKFTDRFPDISTIDMATTFSSVVDTASLPDSLAGGIATGGMNWLPSDNHLSHLTGTLYYFFKGVPGDTGAQLPDELKLVITLAYEGWSTVAPKRRSARKVTAKSSTKSKGKKA
ncbi:MAG: hypothetical protein [Circular genetic element sp.]|nr:MAG: hypothetical protein [Circular genetic element sp.]